MSTHEARLQLFSLQYRDGVARLVLFSCVRGELHRHSGQSHDGRGDTSLRQRIQPNSARVGACGAGFAADGASGLLLHLWYPALSTRWAIPRHDKVGISVHLGDKRNR